MINKFKDFWKKIINWIGEATNKIVEENVKKLFSDFKNYRIEKVIIFFIFLPFSFLFVIINVLSFLFFLIYYFLYFITIKIRIQNVKNSKLKNKTIKYKKRFKFLKDFHLVILEKTILTFPKKKAFLVFYIILKKVILNDTPGLEMNFILTKIKIISNRYFISFFLGIPFIVLSCNNELVKIIWDLKSFNYSSKTAFVNTVILNCYKNLIPEYAKLTEKLKIKISKKKIKFNSLVEIMKASKFTKEFKEAFIHLKKEIKIGSTFQKISDNILTKKHPSLILKTIENINEENISIYMNESSKEEIKIKRFSNKIQDYVDEQVKNNLKHKGSINNKIETYYTPLIKTLSKNIVLEDPKKDKFLQKSVIKENTNNIIAGLTVKLNENMLDTKKIEIENKLEENRLIKQETEKAFLDWVKENKNRFSNETFEALLKINSFWEENEVIIKNLSEENKIKLAELIGFNIEDMNNTKEVNFKIFINFLSEKK